MEQYVKHRKRFRWEILFKCLMTFLLILLVIHILRTTIFEPYEIYYVEYEMKYGDTIFEVVQEKNVDLPWGYTVQDFVHMTVEKNDIHSPSSLQIGDALLIPVAHIGK